MTTVKKFEDLEVWQTSRNFTILVYELTRQEPFSKDYGLKDQICRASVSIMSKYQKASKAKLNLNLFVTSASLKPQQAKHVPSCTSLSK